VGCWKVAVTISAVGARLGGGGGEASGARGEVMGGEL
jgi:hypothetical protein